MERKQQQRRPANQDLPMEEVYKLEEKEEFINALVDFKDGCNPIKSESIDREFYQYRAYFIATAGINEFKECSKTKKIVEQVVEWAFGKLISDIKSSANTTLIETNRIEVIAALVKLIGSTTNEYTRRQAAASLEKMLTKSLMPKVVNTLKNSTNEEAVKVLWNCAQNLSYPEFYSAWHS
jgi:hypothetical protein